MQVAPEAGRDTAKITVGDLREALKGHDFEGGLKVVGQELYCSDRLNDRGVTIIVCKVICGARPRGVSPSQGIPDVPRERSEA
jgi:hypothetical protein